MVHKSAYRRISVLKDNNGEPILPSVEFISDYYAIAEYLNEAYVYEMKPLIKCGKQYIQYKTNPTEENYKPGCIILETSQINELRNTFNSTEIAEITKYSIILSNTKIVNFNQKYISSTAQHHKGEPMPNPITRINLNFSTGKAEFKLYDKNDPKYEEFKVNGKPVDINNIYEAILIDCKLYGIVDLSSICFSSLGISIIA